MWNFVLYNGNSAAVLQGCQPLGQGGVMKQGDGVDGTVGKAFDVLDQVAVAGRPVRFAELLEGSAYPKATLYRLLQTLTRQGMLALDPDLGTYAPGMRLGRKARLRLWRGRCWTGLRCKPERQCIWHSWIRGRFCMWTSATLRDRSRCFPRRARWGQPIARGWARRCWPICRMPRWRMPWRDSRSIGLPQPRWIRRRP